MRLVKLVAANVYSVHKRQYRRDEVTGVDETTFQFLMTRRNDAGMRYFEEVEGEVEVEAEEEEVTAPKPKRNVKSKPKTKAAGKKKTGSKKAPKKVPQPPVHSVAPKEDLDGIDV